ncbi:phage conserved hypothetical protein TIGR01671 [Enterococcus faecalis TX4248]|uniref:YopX protein domain-containing protein n=1 Tax=Enterococcus faecalis TX4248 TaxID=749495 RepID=A0A125W4Y7_ENTFL|nr:YopX family protein [Enterococcus faecalis]EFM82333.1 phage conserved hypothetical protein TIGR01671 [Enterococcus faecalis TX4248]MCD5083313.1 hypothetical protein [Enterococcus faecalis]
MIPKFRAWDTYEKEMLENVTPLFDDSNSMMVIITDFQIKGSPGTSEIEIGSYDTTFNWDEFPYVIMQSTGFKDDNGVEIFEGDVVNIHWFYTDYDPETLGAIENEATAEKVVITKEFGNLGFWWNSGDDWVDLATLALTIKLHEESFELLGNIYENPELLEETE